MNFIMLLNNKMPIIVGILICISMIKITSGRFKTRNVLFNSILFLKFVQISYSVEIFYDDHDHPGGEFNP